MMFSSGIFSIRIVTADYYMEKPKPGLDLCFSDFRAKELKKVPIIRIFGSTAEGVKTCMHIHGIFPYLYIPFDKTNFEAFEKSSYLLASSLDKAINISLGQSSSGSQHVFKIQLVKGIPFYGYHANEHQYLKIYMLNPRFIKRAANLLQSGAIMGKTFPTHESHVPYILQSFIDHNLYGMSFLHVPKEVLKFRRNNEQENIPYNIVNGQILDCNVAAKQSTSKLEVDISSSYILNRFELNKTSTHANPGLEAIWQDEQLRRQNLGNQLKDIPPLVIPPSQTRPDVKPTKSEEFYRAGLLSKLERLENCVDETINETMESSKERKTTFSLTKLLTNTVYPEECSQDDLLTNASVIANHFSSGSIFEASNKSSKSPSPKKSLDSFMDDTIVDEDLVRCLTQPEISNKTLREEDMDLLDVMQELEDNQDDNSIDLDSTLAPLSQNIKYSNSQHVVGPKHSSKQSSEDESDNECLNDFTMVMDDMDDLLNQLSQSSLPDVAQLDGADDILGTPKKRIKSNLPSTPILITPKRAIKIESPKTPKSTSKKYEPLPLLIKSRSVKKNLSEEDKQMEVRYNGAILNDPNALITDNARRSYAEELDKTHITCNFRPRQKRNEVKLKTYNAVLECETKSRGCIEADAVKQKDYFKTKVNLKRFSTPKYSHVVSQRNSISLPVCNTVQKSVCAPVEINQTCETSALTATNSNVNNELGTTICKHIYKRCSPRRILSSNVSKKLLNDHGSTPTNSINSNISVTQHTLDTEHTDLNELKNKCDHNDDSIILKDKCTNIKPTSKKRNKAILISNSQSTHDRKKPKSLENQSGSKLRIYDGSITKKLRVKIKRFDLNNMSVAEPEETANLNVEPFNSSIRQYLGNVFNSLELRNNNRRISTKMHEEFFKNIEIEKSFCERTLCSNFSDTQILPNDHIIVIKPKMKIESFEEVKNIYKKTGIPGIVHKQPFYSNYLDVTSTKEVGHTLLCIPGTTLKDVEDFKSSISSLESFSNYRTQMVQGIKSQLENDVCIKEYLSKDKVIIAVPNKHPPNRQDAKVWLKAKELLHKKNMEKDDSPTELHTKLINSDDVGQSNELANSFRIESSLDSSYISQRGIEPSTNLSQTKDSEDKFKISQEKNLDSEPVCSEEAIAELDKTSFKNNIHNSQGSFDSSFGITYATLNNTFGFKVNLENLQQAKSDDKENHLTIISLEVFVSTREDLLPNPQFDAISFILYAVEKSIASSDSSKDLSNSSGLIIISDRNNFINTNLKYMQSNIQIKEVANEIEGLMKLVEVCGYWDPDIFVGYEIEMSSWGYVLERAKFLDLNIAPLLSRIPTQNVRDFVDEEREKLTDLDVETKLCGRILLDVWRLMRSEIALTSYTFENVMYHILHRRCPLHSYKDLTNWFRSPQTRWIVLEFYLERVHGTLELLSQLDLIGRTSEMAKLIGIQFYEVLSRGSQFRVESMMLRIAKPKNLVPLSPSVQQRAHMRAPEYLPLILEPQSRFYPGPIIVLDFQSLYPSMIIAYNYCFSTCLGRVEHLGLSAPFEFGASQLRTSPKLLRQFLKKDMLTISPCGIVFVKKEIREGILPRMLNEILDTRQMVKQSMKLHKNSTALQRILHSRQLGLKLMANVTYGYTAANFSGRMPCVEVGDSVVAKGRETLERAIKLVEANEEWKVKVVYGDTDSLFVLVPGRCKAEAFKIGSEIAEAVTKDNPQPVKLKLEKVYQPCILQTKKRYVGYMFESPTQNEPIFEAKGIETVRRDGCPAAVKMLEKSLKILFDTADVSLIKEYVCRQFTKLLSGKANIQDLLFAKEFRGLKGYKPTACVPALELTRKWIQSDPRKIPRCGERVQFIVTNGPPGVPLIKLVRSPHDVLADGGLKINAIYYITKAIIPPLNRCLLLIGADVNEWFSNLPRKVLFNTAVTSGNEVALPSGIKKSTISQYFTSTKCIVDCGRQTKQTICSVCLNDSSNSLVILEEKISKLQRGYFLTQFICQSCTGRSNYITCSSLDCPVLYILEMKKRELHHINQIRNVMDSLL